MRRILILTLVLSSVFGCKKETTSASGWTDAETNEVSDWHFKNVSSKMQTLSERGDNAKKEFSKCWTLKMSKEYSYSEYKKKWKEFDDFALANPNMISAPSDVIAIGQKFPVYQRTTEFAVECGNELKM